MTEWAALGIAAAVVWHYAGVRIDAVGEPGVGFDYWVTDGTAELGLEVSGTMTDDLEGRHRTKVRQLLSNPDGVGGYVVVVGFVRDRVIVSFHEPDEIEL